MDFSLASQPFSQKLLQAVCLTLLHSMWQGLIAAVFAGAILLFTSKQKPAFRYNLLCAVIAVFIAGVGLTFAWEMETGSKAFNSVKTFALSTDSNTQIAENESIISKSSGINWISYLTEFCSRNAQVIVAVWLLIFGMKSVQAVTGVFYLRKIRKQNIYQPEESWMLKFKALADKLHITERILLMESENITVPMVIGFFKPIVLVPLGLLANLPAAQIEAILLHELAHIRRRDYLVNLMQIFCENVFFFNPAVLWISYLIKEEREHCCDDLAISVMQNKTSFIHALVSFQEYNLSASAFSMTLSKKRNHLLDRIKRIINNNNKPLDAMEKLFVTISLITVAALSAAVSHVVPEKVKPTLARKEMIEIISPIVSPEVSIVAPVDTLPKKKEGNHTVIHSANMYSGDSGFSTYNVHVDGKMYEIVRKNDKTIALSIDGKDIPESEISSHDKEIEDVIKEIKIAHEQAEADRKIADKRRGEADVLRQQAEVGRKQADQNRMQADAQRVQADKSRAEAENSRRQAELGRMDADKMREQANQLRIDADHMRDQAEKSREHAEVARKRAEEYRDVADQERQEYVKKQNGLIDDLIEAGVIKGISTLSYKLSQEELIVNGVKQPEALHQKLKAKYIKEKAVEMVYNFKGRTGYTSTGVIYTK